jgi:hypothetical protein
MAKQYIACMVLFNKAARWAIQRLKTVPQVHRGIGCCNLMLGLNSERPRQDPR